MKISHLQMMDLIQEAFDSYQTPLSNKLSRSVLIAAENFASAFSKLQDVWSKSNSSLNDIHQFLAILDVFWNDKFGAIMASLANLEEVVKNQHDHIKKVGANNILNVQFQQISKVVNELMTLCNEVHKFKSEASTVVAKAQAQAQKLRRKVQQIGLNGQATIIHQPLTPPEIEKIVIQRSKPYLNTLFMTLPAVQNVLKQARGLYQKVDAGDPDISQTLHQPQGPKQTEQVKALEEIDDTVINYYSAIEALFFSILSIGTEFQYSDMDLSKEIFGRPTPDRQEDLSVDPNWQARKKDNVYRHKLAMKQLFHGTIGGFSDKDKFQRIPKFQFNKNAFLNFISGKTSLFKDPKTQMGPESMEAANYPNEAKKARIITQLETQIKKLERDIQILFAGPASPANKALFNPQTGQYVFPEIADMFKNMVGVKKVYKSKLNEVFSLMEAHQGDIQQFFAENKDKITAIVKLIQVAKVRFKNLMNKMLTGRSFENQPPEEIVNNGEMSRQQNVDDRLKYYNIFKALGYIPKDGDSAPSWLYSN